MSVYLTSSLVSTNGHFAFLNDLDGLEIQEDIYAEEDVLPSHRSRRLLSNTGWSYEDDDDVEVSHHRSRRSADEFIEVNDAVGLAGNLTYFEYLLHAGESQLSCDWDFGDGEPTVTQYDAEHDPELSYIYESPGSFAVTVTCGTSEITGFAMAEIRSSIQECPFTMAQTGHTKTPSDEVTLTVNQDLGSDVIGKATFTLDEEVIDYSDGLSVTWTATDYGKFLVNASVSNGIEEDCVLMANVTVGEPITGLDIRTPGKLVTHRPIEIIVEIDQGTAVSVDVEFSDGNNVLDETLTNYTGTWSHTFSSPGLKSITATLANVFGTVSNVTEILVTDSVEGLVLTVTPESVDIGENVHVTLNGSSDTVPLANVSCTISTGDGRNFTDNTTTLLDSSYVFSVDYSYTEEYEQGVAVSATCEHEDSSNSVSTWIAVGMTINSCSMVLPSALKVFDEGEILISVIGGYGINVNIDYGDGETQDLSYEIPADFSLSHSYELSGEYNVTATAVGADSSSVDCIPDNTTSIVVQENVPADDLFILTAFPSDIDLTHESRINFTLTLDESHNILDGIYVTFLFSDDCSCSLSAKLEENIIQTAAVYNTSGTYTVTAVIANMISAVQKTVEVGVMYPVTSFSMNVSTTALHVGDVLDLDVNPLDGTEIKINVTWDDDTGDTGISHFDESVRFAHSYDTPGDYELCVDIGNDIQDNPLSDCLYVKVLNPMGGLLLYSVPLLVLDPGVSLFRIEMEPDFKRPSEMTCTLDFGDESDPTTFNDTELILPKNIDMPYSDGVQNYRTKLNCSNILGSAEYTYIAQVRKPLSDIFLLEVVEPFYWLDDLEVIAEYTLSIREGEEIPLGEATLDWYFGDGFETRVQKQIVDSKNLETHNFTKPDNYTTKLMISYGAWTDNLTVPLTIADHLLLDITMEHLTDETPGAGPNGTWFEVNRWIRFGAMPEEPDASYTWDIGTAQYTGLTFQYEYPDVGVYAIRLDVQHRLYFESLWAFVHVVSEFTFENISVVDAGGKNITLKAYSTLNVTMEGTGLDSPLCILWVFCNETLYVSGPPNCYNDFYDATAPGLAWESGSQALAHVEYNLPGYYNISVIATNNIHEDVTQTITVTITGCLAPPEVTIKGNIKEIEQAKRYQRSEYISLDSTCVMTCYGLQNLPLFQWAIQTIGSAANATELDTENSPSFTFPPRTFEIGSFNVSMTVTITETTPPLSGVDYTFMNITATPVVVTISGGSARTVNRAKEITFDTAESVDPDEDEQDLDEWQFFWYCMRIYPTGESPAVEGSNLCENFNDVKTIDGKNSSILDFEPGQLTANATYKIGVNASHNGKNETFNQNIETVDGDPVIASIQ